MKFGKMAELRGLLAGVSILVVAGALLSCASIAQNTQPIIFVLAGQSNMVGHGRTEDLSAEQRILPSNVKFFLGADESSLAELPQFGPEATFAGELASIAPERQLVLVKYAVKGTSLLDWAPEWTASRAAITGNADQGPLYKQLLQIIEELPIQNAEFGGILWMQGERDARIEEAGEDYYQNLNDLIVAFRRDLGRPELPFLLGLVNPPMQTYPALDVVREAQRRAAEQIPNVYLVETDDLSKRDDNLHYDSEGIMELGRRFATKVIALGRLSRKPRKAPFA